MQNSKTILCPICRTRMSVAADSNHGNVRCLSCRHVFEISANVVEPEIGYAELADQPTNVASNPYMELHAASVQDSHRTQHQPTPTSQPVKPAASHQSNSGSENRNVMIVLLVVGLCFVAMCFVAAIGIWFLMTRNSAQVARRAEQQPPQIQRPYEPAQPSLRRTQPNPTGMNRPDRATPTKRRTNTGSSTASNRIYRFPTNQQTKYSFNLKTEIRKNQLKVFGMSTYQLYSKNQSPPSIRRQKRSQRVARLAFSSTMTETTRSSNILSLPSMNNGFDSGAIDLDSFSQPTNDWTNDSDELLPLIMLPVSRVGIEDLGPRNRSEWSVENTIAIINVEENDTSPFGRMHPYFSRRSPFSRPGFRDLGNPYSNRRTEVNTATVRRKVDYQIQSETKNEIRVSKVLTIKTIKSDAGTIQQSASAKGYYIFDKNKKMVTKSTLVGSAEISIDQVSVKLPIDYSCQLYTGESSTIAKTPPSTSKSTATPRPTKTAAQPDPNLICTIEKLSWGLNSLDFSPNGMIYGGRSNRAIVAFDPNTKRTIDEKTNLEGLQSVNCTVASPDGKFLLTGGYTGRIEVWEIDRDGKLSPWSKFVGHSSEVLAMCVSGNGKLVASAGRGKKLRIWDLESCKQTQIFDGFKNSICAIHISADNKTVLASDGSVLLKANLVDGKVSLLANIGQRYSRKGSFSPDGRQLAVIYSGKVQLISTETLAMTKEFKAGSLLRAIEYSPDGKHLFVGSMNGIGQWNIESGEQVNSFSGKRTGELISVSPDGTKFASTGNSAGRTLFVYKIPGGSAGNNTAPVVSKKPDAQPLDKSIVEAEAAPKKPKTIRPKAPFLNGVQNMVWESKDLGWGVNSMDISPSGKIYAGKMDRAIRVFDWEKSRQIDEKSNLENLGQVQVTVVSPDGSTLLTGGYSGRIEIWDINERGKLTQRSKFVGHSKEIKSIAVSPDGKTICSGGGGKKARIWNLETSKEIHVFDGFSRAVLAARFSANGKIVYATDGIVLLKADVESGSVINQVNLGIGYAHAAAISNNCQTVAVSVGSEIKMFDSTSFAQTKTLKGRGVQWALKFGPGNDDLFVGCNKVVAQWDWKTESKINEFDVSFAHINAYAISNDGQYLAAIGASAGQKLRVFKIPE